MYCTHCGQLVPDQSKFCTNCGHQLNFKPYQGTEKLPQPPKYVPYYQSPVPQTQQLSAWKLIIGACMFLGAVFEAIYFFGEIVPGMFQSMRYVPFYSITGLIGDLALLAAMCLAIVDLLRRDPRHTTLRMSAALLIASGALQSIAYMTLLAEGLQLKTPVMLFLVQIAFLASGVLMLMNLTGSLPGNLFTVLASAFVSLLMFIGMFTASGASALNILGGIGYILYFAGLAMLFMNREEPSLIPGRRADGIR